MNLLGVNGVISRHVKEATGNQTASHMRDEGRPNHPSRSVSLLGPRVGEVHPDFIQTGVAYQVSQNRLSTPFQQTNIIQAGPRQFPGHLEYALVGDLNAQEGGSRFAPGQFQQKLASTKTDLQNKSFWSLGLAGKEPLTFKGAIAFKVRKRGLSRTP